MRCLASEVSGVHAPQTKVSVRVPDFDSLKIPFFLRVDNQYIVKALIIQGESHHLFVPLKEASYIGVNK